MAMFASEDFWKQNIQQQNITHVSIEPKASAIWI